MLTLAAGQTLYFCRHGETEANVAGRFQGRTIDTPLTEKGRTQTAQIANTIRRVAPEFAGLSYVASPLHRTCLTMEMIRVHLGLAADGFTTDPRIVEINLGAWDGLTHAEARRLDPGAYDRREADKWHVPVPGGGENYAEVAKRAENWVNSLTDDTFAVSHSAFTRILRGLFQGMDWRVMSALDERQGVVFRVRGNSVKRFDPP